MSLPFKDHQVKKRLLPVLWRELLDKVERETAHSTGCKNLVDAVYQLLPARKIPKQTLSAIIANDGFSTDISTAVLNNVSSCLGYGNWPGFVREKQMEDQIPPKPDGPIRDGGDFLLWGP